MFSKKCQRCGRKISKDFDFCPYCGQDFRIENRQKRQEDFGLLGEDDFTNFPFPDTQIRMPFGFNGIFNSLIKEIDKQFKEIDKDMQKNTRKIKPSNSISISISTETGKKPKIEVKGFGPEFEELKKQAGIKETPTAKIPKAEITEEKAKQLAKLPKKEAESKVRRLSGKVVYEIDLPGVKSLKDVVINKLENSIEIKAFTDNNVFFKLLPVKLPILSYSFKDNKLTLELGEE